MTDYFVSIAGNNSNSGSQVAPWLTPEFAAPRVGPGDTCYVLPGTYNISDTNFLNLAISGTRTARVRFISTVNRAALLRSTNTNFGVVKLHGDFIDLIGFDISADTNQWEGVNVLGSYGFVSNNYIHDLPATTITSGGAGVLSGAGVYTTVGNVFDRNLIVNIGTLPLDPSGTVHCAYLQDIDCVFTNNICINSPGYAVTSQHGALRNIIAHNLVINEDCVQVRSQTPPTPEQPIIDDIVANNIFYSITNKLFAMQELFQVTNCRWKNNLLYAPGALPADIHISMVSGTPTGTIQANPQFVNFQPDGTGDYRLKPTSPCIDAGEVVPGLPTNDYYGNKRPSGAGYDIGPFEQRGITFHGGE